MLSASALSIDTRQRLSLVLVAIVALVAHAGAVHGGLVFDDVQAIRLSPVVQGEVPISGAFTRDFWGRSGAESVGSWRPVPAALFALEWRLGGAWLLHAMNVVWHAAASAVVLLALSAIAPSGAALAAALLFAVFAAPSEAVHAIVGRADLLAAVAIWIGLLAHRRGGWGGVVYASTALSIGLLSKEIMLVAPLVWFAGDALAPAPRPRFHRRARVLAYAVVIIGWLVARRLLVPEAMPSNGPLENPLAFAPALERMLGAGRVFLDLYLPGLVVPSRRLHACSAPQCGPSDPSDGGAWLGLAILVLPVALAIVLRRRAPAAAFGLAAFAALFLPVSNVLVAGASVYGERLLYVALPGLLLALVLLVSRLPGRAAIAIGISYFVWNVIALQVRHGEWRDAKVLYLQAVERAPDAALVRSGAALASLELGRNDQAEAHARRATELFEGDPTAWSLLGTSLERLSRIDEARAAFERSIASDPAPPLVADYARFLVRQGDPAAAKALVNRALDVRPRHPQLVELYGRLESIGSP